LFVELALARHNLRSPASLGSVPVPSRTVHPVTWFL
jgi:hypothetical protein